MTPVLELGMRAVAIGVGATIILDLWSLLLRQFGIATANWGMVGRWIGHMPRGVFAHDDLSSTAPIPGELALGWVAHYAIGMVYAALLIAIAGLDWAREPTLLPALIVGWATIVAPFFIMQPGMGGGIAASRTPKPNVARLKALLSHTVFGIGMYATALLTSAIF